MTRHRLGPIEIAIHTDAVWLGIPGRYVGLGLGPVRFERPLPAGCTLTEHRVGWFWLAHGRRSPP